MSLCSFTEKFELNAPVEKVFSHFTDTEKISTLFPPSLQIQVVRRTARYLSQGISIDFKARLFHLPLHWKSSVHSFNPNHHIVHLLQGGLLNSWEHDQYFESLPGNHTRITECLLYHPPMGIIGKLVNQLWISSYLRRLFSFRHASLASFFQTSSMVNTTSQDTTSLRLNHHNGNTNHRHLAQSNRMTHGGTATTSSPRKIN